MNLAIDEEPCTKGSGASHEAERNLLDRVRDARQLLARGMPQEAHQCLSGAAPACETDPGYWAVMGLLCGRLGDCAGSERHLRRALRLDPDLREAAEALAGLPAAKSAEGELPDAKAALSDLARRVPEFSSTEFNLHYSRERACGRLAALIAAAGGGTPFSMIRLNDMEVRLLAFGRVPMGLPSRIEEAEEIARHLGVNPAMLHTPAVRALQEEFLRACLSADILGTQRWTVNVDWARETEAVLRHYGVTEDYLPNEVDVCFNAELLDQGYLLHLLSERRILLVGNAAPAFADRLADAGFRNSLAFVGMPRQAPRIARVVHAPHRGHAAYVRLEDIWQDVARCDFDIALVSASIVGKLISARIKERLGRLALDIGWSMQYLSGESSPVAPARDPAYMRGRRGFSNLFQGR